MIGLKFSLCQFPCILSQYAPRPVIINEESDLYNASLGLIISNECGSSGRSFQMERSATENAQRCPLMFSIVPFTGSSRVFVYERIQCVSSTCCNCLRSSTGQSNPLFLIDM